MMFLVYAQLAGRCYLSNRTDLTTASALEEQDALNYPASPTVGAAVAGVAGPGTRLPSSTTMPSDEEN